MSQYPRDEDFYKNLPAYQDVECLYLDKYKWDTATTDDPKWWLWELDTDADSWCFTSKHTHEPISSDQFRYICEREIAIRETKALDEALEKVNEQYGDALQKLADTNLVDDLRNGIFRAYAKQQEDEIMETFSTGAVREAKKGKGSPVFLLCGFPHTLTELHKHMDNPLGRNWEKGIPLSSFVNGAFRHFLEELSGNGDEKSLISMIWNMMCYAETKHRIQNGTLPAELDDVDRNRYSEINYGS